MIEVEKRLKEQPVPLFNLSIDDEIHASDSVTEAVGRFENAPIALN
jgi:hypothetical protein